MSRHPTLKRWLDMLGGVAVLALPVVSWGAAPGASDVRVHLASSPAAIEIGSAPPPAAAGRLVLHLDDVRLAAGQSAVVRVFVNRPDATAATPQDPREGYVDDLFLVPSRPEASATGARQPGQNLTLVLGAGQAKAGKRMTVTLVPVQPDAAGRLTQPGKVDVTLARPYLALAP
jgi:hypothetical protein